jgi:microcystin-dependent protein
MSEPYLGEIRLFAGNFAPKYNAQCNGQIMSIAQNTALFSLLGTYYGGNGTTTFGLPDFRGRLPVGMGQGPGLSNYTIGEQTGTETVNLTLQQIPLHTHYALAGTTSANNASPTGLVPAVSPITGYYVADANRTGNPIAFASNAVQMAGGSQPHTNLMPSLALTFIIALQGVFPSRN